MIKSLFSKSKGIKVKLPVALIVVAALSLTVAGIYGVTFSVKSLEYTTLHHLEYELTGKASDLIDAVKKDATFLSRRGAFVEYEGLEYEWPAGPV